MNDFHIRIWARGNPGNIAMVYLSALTLRNQIGRGHICNIGLPIFGIEISDEDFSGKIGVHNTMFTNTRERGKIPFYGLSKLLNKHHTDFINIEGFSQNIHNFPRKDQTNYADLFPLSVEHTDCGSEDEIVINIRGGEILEGIHPDYVLIPPEFYHYCIEQSGKKPVFCGQIEDSPYMREVRERFPDAQYIQSRGMEADFNFIRHSKHIVTYVSTFSWLAAWLSDAKTIYFPIAGVLNPGQNRGSMLIPNGDPRYRLFLFPVYFGGHVNEYRSSIDPVRGAWREVDDSLFGRLYPDEPTILDRSLACLDPDIYVRESPELSDMYGRFGISGVINHFTIEGFWAGMAPTSIDDRYYYRAYLSAAWEVASGKYKNALDHYIRIGQQQGLALRE